MAWAKNYAVENMRKLSIEEAHNRIKWMACIMAGHQPPTPSYIIGPLKPIPQIFQRLYGCDDLSETWYQFRKHVDTM